MEESRLMSEKKLLNLALVAVFWKSFYYVADEEVARE